MNEKLLKYFKSDDIHLIQCEHKWCDAYGYEKSQMKKDMLDYITNLQKENERLKEENKHIFSKVNDDELLISNAMNYAEAQDYKSRTDKAIEYIENNQERKTYYGGICDGEDYCILYNSDEVLNILNGVDEQ